MNEGLIPPGVALLLLVAAGGLLGHFVLLQFAPYYGAFQGDWLATIFTDLCLGLAVTGWLALALAELGWFSAGRLGLLWLSVTLVLVLRWWRWGRPSSRPLPRAGKPELRTLSPKPLLQAIPTWVEYLLVGLWLLAAGWLFFRPHQYVLGGADAGVYVNLAANVAETGSILIDDQTLAELDPALYPAFLRPLGDLDEEHAPYYLLPGFYVTDPPTGRIVPQFYPLHPVWQATAISLGGVKASLLTTGLWALLGSLAIYLTIRQIAGWEVAFLGLLALSVNTLQVWFARYPTTEALTQFLLWSGVWATIVWLRGGHPRGLWALLAGLMLGQVFLVRIDTYFLLVLPLALWFYLRWSGRWRAADWWFFGPIGLLALHSLAHAWWQSRPYFLNIFGYGLDLIQRNWWLPLAFLVVGGLGLLLLARGRRRLSRLQRSGRAAALLTIGAVLALTLFAWFIRPNLGGPLTSYDYWYGGGQIPRELDRENLVRLGWYLSPLGLALATAGTCLLIWHINRERAIVLAIGLMFSILYLWRIQANPHQIYAMRRYVPVVMPFAIVTSTFLLGWLLQRQRWWATLAASLLAVLWLASLGWSARGFMGQVDYAGLLAQLQALDARLQPHSVLIFDDQSPVTIGDTVGTPLHFLYGHEVFSLRNRDNLDEAALRAAITDWQAEGRTVYWIGQPRRLAELGLQPGPPLDMTLQAVQLEGVYERKPERFVTNEWILEISAVRPAQLNDRGFLNNIECRLGKSIAATREETWQMQSLHLGPRTWTTCLTI